MTCLDFLGVLTVMVIDALGIVMIIAGHRHGSMFVMGFGCVISAGSTFFIIWAACLYISYIVRDVPNGHRVEYTATPKDVKSQKPKRDPDSGLEGIALVDRLNRPVIV